MTTEHEHAVEMAELAGAALLTLRERLRDGADPKETKDLGDRTAHLLLMDELARRFPHDAVLSEEGKDDFKRLDSERVWIIDPLDGTREYREGRDDWAVHVGLVERGKVISAAVAQPMRDEVFTSAQSPLHDNPARVIVVSRSRPPAFANDIAVALNARIEAVGSAGAKALAVVRGAALAYIHEGGLNEWDAAAPVGVALAHGLCVSDLQGRAIEFNQRDVVLRGGFVLCRPECAAVILRTISET
jgi:3'(2'), 5'-bisphosphate nucleotidase